MSDVGTGGWVYPWWSPTYIPWPYPYGLPDPEDMIYCPVADRNIPRRCCPNVCRWKEPSPASGRSRRTYWRGRRR